MNTEIKQIGMKRQVDKPGIIVIPKEYRDFYHIDHDDDVFVVGTTDGLLISNHKYKVVDVEN